MYAIRSYYGDLRGKYIDEATKEALDMVIVEVCKQYSLPVYLCCQKLELGVKRYER